MENRKWLSQIAWINQTEFEVQFTCFGANYPLLILNLLIAKNISVPTKFKIKIRFYCAGTVFFVMSTL